ncbi:thioredoxin domain-containing protein [Parachlamydia sp. AcF125]|uniref:thioredoxin domain-containing protein n=1 Tax=Parachlamydia sp. AcF125 TaxID=2795736 RepID=UPI001BC952F1|nr:thioredoxin domain-containing protein [Parachlamydia sp. AcF125]MBS4168424.1 hypothetical protein [Parachlamydia sp. AcF125]
MAEHQRYTNRLIHQKSPYLLQHAHNPVDWYPWGNEAFLAAKETDKPIFLSIGYATCHWCHVMEQESFENVEVARALNKAFINIKVDREELPEIDSLYMEFAQSMMSGAAGWPLNVILTPDLHPFFAATYLPPINNHGLIGLMELVQRIHEAWHGEERERILVQSEKIVEIFEQHVHTSGEWLPPLEIIEKTVEMLIKLADPIHGGMKGAPKFPIAYQFVFLLRYSIEKKDSRSLFLVERTLEMMQRGGIYDHLGGGFSRYSVDEAWQIPHFEKMLYDNALLASCYLEAWQATQNRQYKKIGEEILHYILRDMTHFQGGFYSAEDADSEGHEGRFYTWTLEEIEALLGGNESKLFIDYFDVTPEGNFEGRNILHTPLSLGEFAKKVEGDAQQLDLLFAEQKHILWKAREKRAHPFKDDKILTAWNGLMIHAMAEAGCAFGDKRFLAAAQNSAKFIKAKLWNEQGLLRRWRDNEAMFAAGLDEYAFLIRALLTLFETGCGTEWLQWALELNEILELQFKSENGAYYQTNGQDSSLIIRKCQFSDGAEPSGNAIQCENLLRFYQLTHEYSYLKNASDILRGARKLMEHYPPGYCYHLMNLHKYYAKDRLPTITIALNSQHAHFQELCQNLYQHFIPHKAVIWRYPDDELLFNLLPFVKEQVPLHDQTTLYICYGKQCDYPLVNLSEMLKAIGKL